MPIWYEGTKLAHTQLPETQTNEHPNLTNTPPNEHPNLTTTQPNEHPNPTTTQTTTFLTSKYPDLRTKGSEQITMRVSMIMRAMPVGLAMPSSNPNISGSIVNNHSAKVYSEAGATTSAGTTKWKMRRGEKGKGEKKRGRGRERMNELEGRKENDKGKFE